MFESQGPIIQLRLVSISLSAHMLGLQLPVVVFLWGVRPILEYFAPKVMAWNHCNLLISCQHSAGQVLSYSNLHPSNRPQCSLQSVYPACSVSCVLQVDLLSGVSSWSVLPRGDLLSPLTSSWSLPETSPNPFNFKSLLPLIPANHGLPPFSVQSEIIGEHSLQHTDQHNALNQTAT